MTWNSRLLLLCLTAVSATVPAAAHGNDAVSFMADVRPILANKCFACHGPYTGQRQADLRLDFEDSAKAEQDAQPAIAPGRPTESRVIQRITSADDNLHMPPPDAGKGLSAEEIKLLRRVAEGAGWSTHWSYVAPRHHPVPKIEDSS